MRRKNAPSLELERRRRRQALRMARLHDDPSPWPTRVLQNAKVAAEVESDVTSLKRLLEMTPSLTSFLKDPSTPAATKMGILREAAGKLGTSKAVLNLLEVRSFLARKLPCPDQRPALQRRVEATPLQVLGEGGRLGHVPDICDEFMRMASGTRGESMAVVTTFEPLSAAQGKQVGVLLGKILGTAQPLEASVRLRGARGDARESRPPCYAIETRTPLCVQVVAKVDPSIMGGMIVEVGDKYIDLSTRTKLRSIEQAISSA